MQIIPAIDIMNGEAVRLTKGIASTRKVYYKDPLEAARRFEGEGATLIHVVDLDAALGIGDNLNSVARVLDGARAHIQAAGGIRSLERARQLITLGAYRVVLGTAAIRDKPLITDLTQTFGSPRVAVAADLSKGRVMVHGWRTDSGLTEDAFLHYLHEVDVGTLIFTSVDADGTLEGPAVDVVRSLRTKWSRTLVASGGVRGIEDLHALASVRVDGVIVGKALYEGTLDLKEAVREFQSC